MSSFIRLYCGFFDCSVVLLSIDSNRYAPIYVVLSYFWSVIQTAMIAEVECTLSKQTNGLVVRPDNCSVHLVHFIVIPVMRESQYKHGGST